MQTLKNQPTIVFVNGPARSGKDTFGTAMVDAFGSRRVYLTKMAKQLKERTHALYGLTNWIDRELAPHDAFEDVKDEPNHWFMGITPRQAYIGVSELYMKAVHGQDVWGRMLLRDILECPHEPELVVITDSGFAAEAVPTIKHFGADNCILVRLRRHGFTFAGDSRSYIELPGVQTFDIPSETVDQLREEAIGLGKSLLSARAFCQ